MFESSLIDLEAKKHPRRRWAPLPIAVALHVAVLASITLAQAWQVAEVGEPPIVSPYHVLLLPPPPPAPAVSRPQPRYTEVARRAAVQGAVIIEAIIDEYGRVADARILKGLPLGLDQEALTAVREWRFQPATLGGRPVKVFYTLTVHFQIQR
jgi:TonB family protein